ncbi:MAG: HlyD family efflux transporter periplasmic adaptor subunit [Desulfitobacteriaceae bacterium]
MKKGNTGKRMLTAVVLLIAVTAAVWIYRTGFTARDLEYVRAETGAIKHEQTVRAAFANEEYLLQAPSGGEVEKLAVPGQRIRRGESAARIKQVGRESKSVPAPAGGLVFYKVDGLESLWTAANFKDMDLKKLLEMPSSEKEITTAQSGQAIGKIINNLAPTAAFVEMQSLEGFSVGKSLRFAIDGKVFPAKVVRKSESPTGVVVEFRSYVDGSAEQRRQEITWIMKPEGKGVVIPRSALWTKGEEQGVFAVMEGVLHFRRVKVQDENETETAVEDLPSGLLVVKNPGAGLEGQPARLK